MRYLKWIFFKLQNFNKDMLYSQKNHQLLADGFDFY